jgi:hypothetical protein
MSEPTGLSSSAVPRAVTWRSVGVGLCGVVFICGLAPYNDWVVNNTYVVGTFLPVGLLLFFFLFVMVINAPLHLIAGSRQRAAGRGEGALGWSFLPTAYRLLPTPLSGGELAVALGMTLVSCTLPGSGLMRYLPAFIVGTYYHAGGNADFMHVLREANPPDWMYPRFGSEVLEERPFDPVIANYVGRVPADEDTFAARWRAVPWGAWVVPALTWGALMAGIYGAVLCMAVIVRRQWMENERLAFPLATVYLTLIEPPEAGRGLNALFRSRGFWIAAGAVFFIHIVNGLVQYYPRYVPEIPLTYDLRGVFTEEPWRYMTWSFMMARVFFSVIGLVFLVQTNIAFSLWFFFILFQVTFMSYGMQRADYTVGMRLDQLFGAVVVFAGVLLWLGRSQWGLVLRQMLRGRRRLEGTGRLEPQDHFLPYSVAGWGLVICLGIVLVWLVAAGATVIGAVVIVGMLFMLFFVVARIAAETGVLFTQLPVPVNRPWIYMLQDLPWEIRTTERTFFLGAKLYGILGHDLRESAGVFTTHALKVGDEMVYGGRAPAEAGGPMRTEGPGWRRGVWFIGALVLALSVGFVVAGASMLYVNYSYAATLDERQDFPISPYAVAHAPLGQMYHPSVDYVPPRTGPSEPHSRLGHFTFGAALTGVLSVLRLRYVSWPLHPVGYLLMGTHAIANMWFSIMLGWVVKVLIVRFGGARMFRGARFFFIGLILGEAGAAAFWLVTGFARNMMGLPYYPIHVLPT